MRRELQEIEEKLKPLAMRYSAEKRALDELRALQKKRDELKVKLAEAENRMDLAMVADIKCGPHPLPILLLHYNLHLHFLCSTKMDSWMHKNQLWDV